MEIGLEKTILAYQDKLDKKYTALLFDPEFKSPDFYNYYPHLFKEVFGFGDEQVLDKLSLAGFLLYKATVLSDKIVDQEDGVAINSDFVITGNLALEESVKTLAEIFAGKPEFWRYWYQRKKEYYTAIECNSIDYNSGIGYQDILQLFDGKSSLGQLAIDALFVLVGEREDLRTAYEDILASHRYFSIAFQIYDDVKDYRKDVQRGQFNAGELIVRKMIARYGLDTPDTDIVTREKLLYTSGAATWLYKVAMRYGLKAYRIAGQYGLKLWQKIIGRYLQVIRSYSDTQALYCKILEAKIDNSDTKARLPRWQSFSSHVGRSLTQAGAFLEKKQKPNGAWEEYITAGGISTFWATGFVLAHCDRETVGDKVIRKATEYLGSNSNALWSYNELWPSDSDSSNFALLAFNRMGLPRVSEFDQLLSFRNADGGFPTYSRHQIEELIQKMQVPEKSDSFSGWCSSHNCVSAVTLYLMTEYYGHYTAEIEKTVRFFTGQVNTGGLVDSYWWTSDMYVVYYLAKANRKLRNEVLDAYIVSRLKHYLPQAFGLFADKQQYLGMLLYGLCEYHRFFSAKDIRGLADFLLRNQMSDGSWKETSGLRLPRYNDHHPDSRNWIVAESGLNTISPEFNRLFTTCIISDSLKRSLTLKAAS